MTNLKYGVAGAAGFALMLTVASAQDITRVRGTIDKVDGNTLLVKSREGATLTIKLKDGATVTGVDKAALADIKQNSFIGITARSGAMRLHKPVNTWPGPHSRMCVAPAATKTCTVSTQRTGLAACFANAARIAGGSCATPASTL